MIPYADDYRPAGFPAASAAAMALLAGVLLAFPLLLRDSGVYYYNLLALFPARFFHHAGTDPVELLTPVTSSLMHLTGWHLFFHCYLIHLFGPRIEDRCGKAAMIGLLVGGGVLGNLAAAVASPESSVRIVGISGGTAALLAFHARAFPDAKVKYMIPFIKIGVMPSTAVLGIYIGMSAIGCFLGPSEGMARVGHVPHLLGLFAGFAAGSAYLAKNR